jgi:hypothetical protein
MSRYISYWFGCRQLYRAGTTIGLQTNNPPGNSAGNPHGGAARSDVGPRVTHVLGIVAVNLREASGNTAGYCCWFDVGPRARHFTGCCWFMCLGQHIKLLRMDNALVGYFNVWFPMEQHKY